MVQRTEIRRLGHVVSSMALPVLVEQFFIVIMGVINTMLASNLGKTAISAVGMIDSISNIIVAFFSALALGGTVTVAQFTGHGDREKANQTAGQALMSNLVIAALVTLSLLILKKALLAALYGDAEAVVLENALDYLSIAVFSYIPIAMVSTCFGILRGSGDTRTPMIISITMNALNVLFSSILIYGIKLNLGSLTFSSPSFGVRGAATGLTLARIIGMLLVLIPLLRGKKGIKLNHLRLFKPRLDLLQCIFRLGIPASAEQLMFQGGRLVTQTFIVGLGTNAIAANAICSSINTLSLIPGQAMAIAATAIIGQQIGAGKPKEAKKRLVFLIFIASAAMGLTSLLMLVFRYGFIHLYTQDPQIVDQVAIVILAALLVQPFIYATSFITPAGLRGAGDIRYTMVVSIASMWALRIFLGYVFGVILHWGVLGVWFGMFADWFGRSLLFVYRMLRGDWTRRGLIRDSQDR